MAESENIVVSVIVVTYNSQNTVLETLESIKVQDFKNLELIISDDSSTDNTISLCESWLQANKHCFNSTMLLTFNRNTGVSANCNRGLKKSTSNYIKLIAGDDLLVSNAITEYVKYANSSTASFFISKMYMFKDFDVNNENIIQVPNYTDVLNSNDPKLQYNKLLYGFFGCAPTLFLKKRAIEDIGFFDERINFMEDYPLALNATKHGYEYSFIDKCLVKYRISEQSTHGNTNDKVLFNNFYRKKIIFDRIYRFPNIKKSTKYSELYFYNLNLFFDYLNLNKNLFINRSIYTILKKINFLQYI